MVVESEKSESWFPVRFTLRAKSERMDLSAIQPFYDLNIRILIDDSHWEITRTRAHREAEIKSDDKRDSVEFILVARHAQNYARLYGRAMSLDMKSDLTEA